jgi:hypothetical protein
MQREEKNLDRDLEQKSAPLKWTYNLSTSAAFPVSGVNTAVSWSHYDRQDLLPDPTFHQRADTLRLSAMYSPGALTFDGNANIEIEKNLLNEDLRITHDYLVSMRFRSADDFRFHFAATYDGSIPPGRESTHDVGWRAGSTLKTHVLDLGVTLRNSRRFSPDGLEYGTFGASADIDFQFGPDTNMTLSAYYDYSGAALNGYSGGVSLDLSTSLGIPIGKKKGIGALKGTVVDADSGGPLPNIIVRSGAEAAATDGTGRFLFPALTPGVHLLDIDSSQSGTFLQPFMNTPIEVVVEDRKTTTLTVEMGKRCAISGTVTQYAFPDQDGSFKTDDDDEDDSGLKPAFIAVGGVRGMLLSLSNGVETYRRLTDSQGRFSFDDLIPGAWTLTVHEHNIPAYHAIEDDTFVYEMDIGERETVEIRLLPQKRKVQMIDEGVLAL